MEQNKSSFGTKLKSIWNGTIDKRTYGFYLLTIFIIYFFGIIFGAAVYAGGFSINNVYVSYLGSQQHDPTGYLVYNTTVLIAGILLIPHFIYLYKRLRPTFKAFNFLGCLVGIVGAIGFAGLSIFHQDLGGHILFTDLAYYPLGGSALFLLFVFCKKLSSKESWPKIWQIALIYG